LAKAKGNRRPGGEVKTVGREIEGSGRREVEEGILQLDVQMLDTNYKRNPGTLGKEGTQTSTSFSEEVPKRP